MFNPPTRARWVKLSVLALAASGAAACSDVGVTDTPSTARPQLAVTPPSPVQEQLQLCVNGPAGTYSFTVGENDPSNVNTLNAGTAVNVNADQCVLISTTDGNGFFDTARVSVNWTGVPTTVTLTDVDITEYIYERRTDASPTSTVNTTVAGPATSFLLRIERAGLLIYNFAGIPQEVLEGCSPGYWKQSHHFDSYPAAYTPTTLFSSVFENAFPGKTLVQVLSQGGGGLNSLGRHIVAALLSSEAGLNTGYTTQEVIDAFNAAFPSSSYSGIIGEFEAVSNALCTLN